MVAFYILVDALLLVRLNVISIKDSILRILWVI